MTLSRRQFLRVGAYAVASSVVPASVLSGCTIGSKQTNPSNGETLNLQIAGYPFEHVRGLMTGQIQVRNCKAHFEVGRIGDLNTHVFSGPQTLDITEIGFSPFLLAYANEGFRAYSLIPVFPLRTFRHKSIFVHADRGIEHPVQLKGKRVGTPGYSSTSLTWIRGMLEDEYGVRSEDIEWVLSAADSSTKDSGSTSKQENILPEGLSVSVGPPGKDESALLLDGDVDALFHAAEPRAFTEGHPKIRRLFIDPRQAEQEYYRKTGIFPIMHAVAIRNELVKNHPWLPKAVFEAYSRSKSLAYRDMRRKWYLRTLPWFAQELEVTQNLMGKNFFPYGVEANRLSLDTLLRYSHRQGLAKRRIKVEEMFEASTIELTDV